MASERQRDTYAQEIPVYNGRDRERWIQGDVMEKGDLFIYVDDWRREWTCVFLCKHIEDEYKDWMWVYVFLAKQRWVVHEEQLRTFSVLDIPDQ
tara:strand:+ start:1821 stop:2102 length:282 start_codon:yes stop_codon:yes gene_type:complete